MPETETTEQTESTTQPERIGSGNPMDLLDPEQNAQLRDNFALFSGNAPVAAESSETPEGDASAEGTETADDDPLAGVDQTLLDNSMRFGRMSVEDLRASFKRDRSAALQTAQGITDLVEKANRQTPSQEEQETTQPEPAFKLPSIEDLQTKVASSVESGDSVEKAIVDTLGPLLSGLGKVVNETNDRSNQNALESQRTALVAAAGQAFTRLDPEGKVYGSGAGITPEQNQLRTKTQNLAKFIHDGAAANGINGDFGDAMKIAHSAMTADNATDAARQKIKDELATRAKQITTPPDGTTKTKSPPAVVTTADGHTFDADAIAKTTRDLNQYLGIG